MQKNTPEYFLKKATLLERKVTLLENLLRIQNSVIINLRTESEKTGINKESGERIITFLSQIKKEIENYNNKIRGVTMYKKK